MSTPPVLASCSQYEPECIGRTQKALFYTGMALIAVGVAGNNVSLKPFLQEQEDRNDSNGPNICVKIFGAVFVVVVALTGAIALPYIKPWTLRFGIPAICTVVATVLFVSGLCCYRYDRRRAGGSHVAKLCRARMIPMLTTFVFCGIVSSIGNTYFVEQANNLNRKMGKWKVPPQVLLLAQKGAGNLVGAALKEKGVAPGKGVATAILFAVLCCITAARMEFKRLGVVARHGLLEKPDEDVPMSIFWLIFQFVLLACLDKFLEKSVAKFGEIEFPDESEGRDADGLEERMVERRYPENLAKGVSGFGFMCGVLSVYVVGEVSKRGGNASWFQDTLNTSRLDRYYWVLAALGSVNLFVYAVVTMCCRCFNR